MTQLRSESLFQACENLLLVLDYGVENALVLQNVHLILQDAFLVSFYDFLIGPENGLIVDDGLLILDNRS